MNVGDKVRIVKCDKCSKVVGRTVKVTEVQTVDQVDVSVKVSFGRGRPQLGRPSEFMISEVACVEGEV